MYYINVISFVFLSKKTVAKFVQVWYILNEKGKEKLDKTIIVKSTESVATITVGKLSEGFENFEINQIVVTADELVDGGKKKKTFANQAYREGEKVVFADLKIGDYVVHKNYGIGIFVGVNTITADGTTKDYLK